MTRRFLQCYRTSAMNLMNLTTNGLDLISPIGAIIRLTNERNDWNIILMQIVSCGPRFLLPYLVQFPSIPSFVQQTCVIAIVA